MKPPPGRLVPQPADKGAPAAAAAAPAAATAAADGAVKAAADALPAALAAAAPGREAMLLAIRGGTRLRQVQRASMMAAQQAGLM